MQRNMDLVRTILTRLEGNPGIWAPRDFGIYSFSEQEVGYHAHIMKQERLIEAIDTTTTQSSGPEAMATGLTWQGHEFLELARDQDRWNKAKAIISRVGGAPLSVWTKVLTDLMMQGVDAATNKAG